MKKNLLFALTFAALASQSEAIEFKKYVGQIKTKINPFGLSADSDGNLYFSSASSVSTSRDLNILKNPDSYIGDTVNTYGEAFDTITDVVGGRYIQTVAVSPSGNFVFACGDNGGAASPVPVTIIKKYTRTVQGDLPNRTYSFTADSNFSTNFQNDFPAIRVGNIAIISEQGNGLIAGLTLTGVIYCDFNGHKIDNPINLGTGNYRKPVFNSQKNIIYPLRNGVSNSALLVGYIDGFNTTTGGGTFHTSSLIADGASNTASGVAGQQGYYYAQENQLITVDSAANTADGVPAIRAWNTGNDGKTFSLAYSVNANTTGAAIGNYCDVVVANNRLYVTSTNQTAPGILVFEAPPANVDDWKIY